MTAMVGFAYNIENLNMAINFLYYDNDEYEKVLEIISDLRTKFPQRVMTLVFPTMVMLECDEEFVISVLFYLMLNYNMEIAMNGNFISCENYTHNDYENLTWLLRDYIKEEKIKVGMISKKVKELAELFNDEYINGRY